MLIPFDFKRPNSDNNSSKEEACFGIGQAPQPKGERPNGDEGGNFPDPSCPSTLETVVQGGEKFWDP